MNRHRKQWTRAVQWLPRTPLRPRVLLPTWNKIQLCSFKSGSQYLFCKQITCTHNEWHMSTYIREHGAQRIHDNGWWERSKKYTEGQTRSRQEGRIPATVHWGWGWHLGTWWGRRSELCWSHSPLAERKKKNIKRELRKVYSLEPGAETASLCICSKARQWFFLGMEKGFTPVCLLCLPLNFPLSLLPG